MSYVHPARPAHQRKRFTRADAYRFAAPGSPEAKPPGWLDPSATRVRLKEAQEQEARAAFAAEVKALQAQQDRLCEMLAEIEYEFAWRRFVCKYSPSQPRVPAGNPDGGQWTRAAEEGTGSDASDDEGAGSDDSDAPPDSGDAPQDSESLAQALRRFPASDQPPRSDRQQLEAIANDPLIRAYMDEAWLASNPYGIFPKEHGFWISRDDVSGQLFTRPFAGRGVENQIDPGPPPPDAIAFFHTHPYGGIQLGAAPPSPGDEVTAARLGLPGLIQSHVGVYYFGPPLRPAR
jgi:hypothetical protein